MRRLGIGVAAASAALVGAQACADDLRGRDGQPYEVLRGRYVHVGVHEISLNPNSVELSVGGAAIPGASFDAGAESGAVMEFGWFPTEWPIAVSFMLTSSVLTENVGTGPLAATPNLGSDSFMLASLTGHYHFDTGADWFRPYAGGGLGYFHPTGVVDGVVTNLEVKDAYGAVFQIGADFDITETWGAFIDLKQFLIGIEAAGSLGGAPVEAKADIDPLVVNSGLSYRF